MTCRCTTKTCAPSQWESCEMLDNITGVSKCKHPLTLSLAGNYSFKVLQPIRHLKGQDNEKTLLVYFLYALPCKILGSVCQCYISNENSKVQKMIQKGNQGSFITVITDNLMWFRSWPCFEIPLSKFFLEKWWVIQRIFYNHIATITSDDIRDIP